MPSSEECIPSQHHQKLFAPTVCHWQRMEIHRILFSSRSHSSRSLLLYKTHVFLEMMMRKSKSSRASFLIVPCTALQWRAHQSCLQLEQNNIVTAATAPKRRKDFSRFFILVQVIEGESSLKSPLNCQQKLSFYPFPIEAICQVIQSFINSLWTPEYFWKLPICQCLKTQALPENLKFQISNFWGGVIAFWDLLDYGIAEKITGAEKDFLSDIPFKNIFDLSSCQLHWDCSIMQCQVNLQAGACIFLETRIRHLVLQRSEVQNQK